MARLVATLAWTTILALPFGVGCTKSGNPQTASGGAGGAGGSQTGSVSSGDSVSSASSTSSVSSAVSTGASVSSGAGGSMMPFVCDPPAEPGSIYETAGESFNIEEVDPISMCKYRGQVMLVVNTAAA